MSCAPDLLTEILQSKLSKPESSPDFDLHGGVEQVLKDVGMVTADCGGKLSFFGRDPIIPSSFRFGAMAAIGLAAKAIAAASLWRSRTGEGQDIAVDVRKALRRFCGFFEREWETINGRPPAMGADAVNPFFDLPLFRETRDGRDVVALNIYPRLCARPQLPQMQRERRIRSERHSAVARGGAGDGRGRGRPCRRHGPHKRGISQRAPMHRGPLRNAADSAGQDWRLRAAAVQ